MVALVAHSTYGTALEYDDLVSRQCPVTQQIHIPRQYSFNHVFRLDPASLTARASSGDFTSSRQGFNHPLDIVVTIWRFLPLAGTLHPITSKKNTHRCLWSLNKVQGQTKRTIGPFIPIRAIIDDKKYVSWMIICHFYSPIVDYYTMSRQFLTRVF
jgi:hypothetical protein